MDSLDDIDWEEYFENYVLEHPDMPFTQVCDLIAEKLRVSLKEVISDIEGSSIIDHIWEPEDSLMSATDLIDIIAQAFPGREILSDPSGREALDNLYNNRKPLSTPPQNPTESFAASSATQPERNTLSKPDKRLPKSNAGSRTETARIVAFVEIPTLVAKIIEVMTPWRKLSDGINAITKQVAGRLGQAKFRQDLFENYGCRCLITGCTVPHVVEAAHIRPYKSKGDFAVDNGIPLRSDLHMLFDQNLLAFQPDTLRVELHPRLKETEYKFLSTDNVCLKVEDAPIKPNREALQERYDAFLKTQINVDYSYAGRKK